VNLIVSLEIFLIKDDFARKDDTLHNWQRGVKKKMDGSKESNIFGTPLIVACSLRPPRQMKKRGKWVPRA